MPVQLLAGLLYAGAALALGLARLLGAGRREAPLARGDGPRLAAVALTGGVAAPVLLLAGLERTGGLTGSLLLNLEGPLTVLLALTVFGEHLGRRAALGAATILAGALVVGLGGEDGSTTATGALLVAGACALWALDNNLSQRVASRSPLRLVLTKAGVAAATNLTLAVGRGERPSSAGPLVAALAVGAVSYGASVLLDAHALRLLGAAREAVLFATAPFVGAVLAVPLLGEDPTTRTWVAAALMVAGVGLLLADGHSHVHDHLVAVHTHPHRHDDGHHAHAHDPPVPVGTVHAHPHRHEFQRHRHPHPSDAEHRHRHRRRGRSG